MKNLLLLTVVITVASTSYGQAGGSGEAIRQAQESVKSSDKKLKACQQDGTRTDCKAEEASLKKARDRLSKIR